MVNSSRKMPVERKSAASSTIFTRPTFHRMPLGRPIESIDSASNQNVLEKESKSSSRDRGHGDHHATSAPEPLEEVARLSILQSEVSTALTKRLPLQRTGEDVNY
jgi:hypothetical protein